MSRQRRPAIWRILRLTVRNALMFFAVALVSTLLVSGIFAFWFLFEDASLLIRITVGVVEGAVVLLLIGLIGALIEQHGDDDDEDPEGEDNETS